MLRPVKMQNVTALLGSALRPSGQRLLQNWAQRSGTPCLDDSAAGAMLATSEAGSALVRHTLRFHWASYFKSCPTSSRSEGRSYSGTACNANCFCCQMIEPTW